jgi:TonB family protein
MKRSVLRRHNTYMRHAASYAVLWLICISPELGQSADAQTILARAANAYHDLDSFQLDAVMTFEQSAADFDQTIRSKLSVAGEKPDRVRVDVRGMGGITTVSDGKQTWTYQAFLKQYTKNDSPQSLAQVLSSSPVVALLPHEGLSTESARLIGEEQLPVGGDPHVCYVIEVKEREPVAGGSGAKTDSGSTRFWIDKTTYLVLKSVTSTHIEDRPMVGGPTDMKNTLIVQSLKTNQPLSADLFAFTPPAGAKAVESFQMPGEQKSDLVGKRAPDFQLEDVSGQKVDLASLSGKTVLLDFWATWCGPCRQEIPVIEKLHRENTELTILGVDVGEDVSVVRKFLGENEVTYPILLAGNDHMVEAYRAHSFPSVVIIDKDGVIRNYITGYGPDTESKLRAEIVAAAKPSPPVEMPEQVEAPSHTEIYSADSGVAHPSVIYKIDPDYTEQARKKHVSGTVVLALVVSAKGIPQDISVVHSLEPDLDEKAIEAVHEWRFKPGMKDGKPVMTRATIEVNFRLLDSPKPPTAAAAQPAEPPATAEEAYRRASRLMREKRTEEGIALYGTAIAMKPEWAPPYAARGRVEYQHKNYSDAIQDFDAAIRLDPNHASWYDERGLALSYSGHHDRAIADYTRAIEIAPTGASAYNNRGWAWTESGEPEKGIPDLTRAIEMSPDYQKAYENRAKAWMQLKDWPHAIQDLTAAIQVNPNAWAYRTRAEAKQSIGDETGAAEDKRKADELTTRTAAQ